MLLSSISKGEWMNLLVTGSSGYIGRSFITTHQNHYHINTFSLRTDDLNSLSLDGIDTILHCAALVHRTDVNSPESYRKINRDYPVELAQKAKEAGVKHFVFLSTVAVYGEKEGIYDEFSPASPVTLYAKSKYDAENALRALESDTFKLSIVRPAMVYGKDAPGNMQRLITLVDRVPILPFGKIENKRHFVSIDNLTALLSHIIDQHAEGCFVAADDTPVSTTYLTEKIALHLHRKIQLISLPQPVRAFIRYYRPNLYQKLFGSFQLNNHHTKEKLHFHMPYSFDEGFSRIFEKEPVCTT